MVTNKNTKLKETIIKIVEELLKNKIYKDSYAKYSLILNGKRKIELLNINDKSLVKITDIINNESKINNFNFTVQLKDVDDNDYREVYPISWYTSQLIFYGTKARIEGFLDFLSDNISVNGSYGKFFEIEDEDDIHKKIPKLIELHEYYVTTNNTIAEKFKKLYKLK